MNDDGFLSDLSAQLLVARQADTATRAELEPLRRRIEDRVIQIATRLDANHGPIDTRMREDTNAFGNVVEIAQRDDGSVVLSIYPPDGLKGPAVLGFIGGFGFAAHQKTIVPPQMNEEGMVFGSMNDLVLSLNALAKSQDEKIPLPEPIARNRGEYP